MRETARLFCLFTLTVLLASPLGAQSREVKRLMKDLSRSQDSSERAEAAWELGQIGATEAIPLLIDALQDRSSSVRANAAASLWNMADAAESAEPALREALNDPYAGVVSTASGALRRLGVAFEELEPAYWRLLEAPRCRHRNDGLRQLIGKVPPTKLFFTAVDCANDDDLDNRLEADKILRRLMDPNDRSLVPLILDALGSPGDSAWVLGDAIVAYDPPIAAAVPVLEALLKDPEPEVRKAGAHSLGRMKDIALPALQSLIQTLGNDTDPGVRESAAKAIGDMGKSADAAVPALIEAARSDQWPDVRSAAIDALGEMRELARDAIPVLDKALEDPDSFIRISARNALFRIDPDNKAKVAEKADRPPATAAKVSSKLHEDVTGLKETLIERVPVVYEVVVYPDFAMATAPEPTAPGGVGSFFLRNGAVTGPDASHATCDKTFNLAEVDFSVLPRVVQEAPGKAGAPDAKVTHVSLGRGVFCKKVGWWVGLQGSKNGVVEFKLDGKFVDAKVY
jgi:HEAT repeat protein